MNIAPQTQFVQPVWTSAFSQRGMNKRFTLWMCKTPRGMLQKNWSKKYMKKAAQKYRALCGFHLCRVKQYKSSYISPVVIKSYTIRSYLRQILAIGRYFNQTSLQIWRSFLINVKKSYSEIKPAFNLQKWFIVFFPPSVQAYINKGSTWPI